MNAKFLRRLEGHLIYYFVAIGPGPPYACRFKFTQIQISQAGMDTMQKCS